MAITTKNGTSKNDKIISNDSIINGLAGDDDIIGGAASQGIFGGIGNDRLRGLGGSDILSGGAGSDTFIFENTLVNNGVDTIIDFKKATHTSNSYGEYDVLDLSAAFGGRTIKANNIDTYIKVVDGKLYLDLDGTGNVKQSELWANLTGIVAGDKLAIKIAGFSGFITAKSAAVTAPATPNAALTTDSSNDLDGYNTDGITKSGAISAPANVAPGAVVEYRTFYNTVWGAWGAYTSPLTNGTVDGAYTVEVRQTLNGISSASQSIQYVLDCSPATAHLTTVSDNVGTITGTLSSGDATDDTLIVLAGTNEAGSVVNIYNGSSFLGTATVTGMTWSYTAAISNAITYLFNAKEIDPAGNGSAATANFVVTGDMSAPATPIFVLASDTGNSGTDGITNNGTINVSGIEATATWAFSTDGGVNWSSDQAASVTSFDLPTDSTYTINDVQVRQTDSVGNMSTTPAKNAQEIVVDNTDPTATLYYSTDNGASYSTTISVRDADTLKIKAVFSEAIADDTGASIAIDHAVLSATAMTKLSSTEYTYDLNVPTGYIATTTVTIDAAADVAGNTMSATPTDNTFTIANVDTSIVIFDLVGGTSSSHSGRFFDPNTAYTIYINTAATGVDIHTDGNSGNGTWGTWAGASNLSADDTIYFSANGSSAYSYSFPHHSSLTGVSTPIRYQSKVGAGLNSYSYSYPQSDPAQQLQGIQFSKYLDANGTFHATARSRYLTAYTTSPTWQPSAYYYYTATITGVSIYTYTKLFTTHLRLGSIKLNPATQPTTASASVRIIPVGLMTNQGLA